MADDVSIVVGIRGDESGGRVIKKSLDDIATSGDKAVSATKRLELQAKATAAAGDAMGRAFAAIGAVIGLSQIAKYADQYTMLEGRIKLATRSTAEFSQAFAGLKTVSNQTGASLSDAVDVFQRLSFVRDEIGATVGQMVQFTGTVQKMGVMSGASTTAMSAGLLQLGQALSAGVVRAEEFNSVVENTPVIAKAIADQFGVTTGQLRQLVLKGLVDSADVFNAVLNEAASVEQKYAEMPVTIGRALSQLENQFMEFIGVNAQASGAAMTMVGVLNGLRLAVFGVGKAFDLIANGIGIVAQSILTTIQNLANSAIGVVNFITEQANRIPGVNTPLVGKVSFAADWSEINTAAGAANDQFFGGKTPTTVFDKLAGGTSDAAASAPIKAMSKDYADLASKISNTTKLTKEQREAIKQKKKEAADALREEKKLQDTLKDAVKDSRSETEKLYDKISEMEKLRPFAKTAEQATAISKNIKNAQDELEKLRIKAELDGPVGKAFQSLAKEIDDDFKDAFKSAFTKSDGGFKALLNGWKNSFKNFLADLAYQATVRPILVSIAGSVGSSLGLSGNAVASVLGTAGKAGAAGSGGGGIASLLSTGSSLMSAGTSLLSGGTSALLTSSVNRLGNFLGIGGVGANGPVSLSSYSSFTNGSFGGTLGAGAGAFGGNLLANSLFGKNRGIGSTIGGTIGGIAGSFIPVPILGPMIGSFIGNYIGGLFGNKQPSDKSAWGSIDFATMAKSGLGNLSGKKFSAQNVGARDTILNQISGVLGLVGQYGGSATGSAAITIGNRDGLRYNGKNFGQNGTAFSTAIFGDLRNSITGLDKTFTTILDKLGLGTSLDTLTSAFQFGQSYNETLRTSDTMKVLADSIKALDENMAAAISTATNLGLPIEEYTKALQKQKDAAVGALKAQAAGFSSLSDMTRAFDSFFNGQALGSSSSLTPMQKLQTAQSAFGDLLTKAQGGDMSVTPDLLSAASTLIDQGRNVYASGTDFSNLEGFVRSSVQGVAKSAGYSGQNVAYSIVSTNQQLVTQGADQTQAIQDMKAELFRLSNKIAVLTDKVA